jgi:trans-aconitate methyltransferase
MTKRALTFGSVASRYEKFRSGYPAELVDEVLGYAAHSVRTAVEIGAGTGKATREFARRGIAVTATDPDQAMLIELRRHVPEAVRTMQAPFETIPLTARYDLVFAAAALHWTQPAGRWERVAALLNPGGIFASFGGQLHLADAAVEQAVRAARAPYLGDDGVPSPDGTPAGSPMQWPGTELLQSQFGGSCRAR